MATAITRTPTAIPARGRQATTTVVKGVRRVASSPLSAPLKEVPGGIAAGAAYRALGRWKLSPLARCGILAGGAVAISMVPGVRFFARGAMGGATALATLALTAPKEG